MTEAAVDVDAMIRHLLAGEWQMFPQLTHTGSVNALVRFDGSTTDVLTIQPDGWAIVARLRGGAGPQGAFARAGAQQWRYAVPLWRALRWAIADRDGDSTLAWWVARERSITDPNHSGSLP